MDTNVAQSSLSPCQVGIVQNNLNSCLQGRFVYKCSPCPQTRANFDLPASSCGSLTNIWLDGRASWNGSSFKLEIDQFNRAAPNDFVGSFPIAGTHYESDNFRAVGREQLDAVYTFAANKLYRVKITTYTGSYCSSSVRTQFFTTNPCTSTSLTGPAPMKTITTSTHAH